MDPNENLKKQLAIAAMLMEQIENDRKIRYSDVIELAEFVIALDNWIMRGGFLPTKWDQGRTLEAQNWRLVRDTVHRLDSREMDQLPIADRDIAVIVCGILESYAKRAEEKKP